MSRGITRRGRRWHSRAARLRCGNISAFPDQHLAAFIARDLLALNQLFLERLKLFLVQRELQLQCSIGEPPPLLQEGCNLVDDGVQVHQCCPPNSSSNALASCRSLVSKPSVNQP